MDQSDNRKLQGAVKFQKDQFFKRILQFVFSVSVFSFFVWYSSAFSILPHDESFNAYFSTFLFSMFTHTLERKYMFLLCNAILAFLVKTSLTTSPSSMSACDIDDESLQATNLSETKALSVSEEATSLMAEEQEIEQEKKPEHFEKEDVSEAEEEQEDGENTEASIAKEDEEEVGTGGSGAMVATQDDEADTTMAANEELSNADELNRKFEEFIRKMKEEIRIEAQRQLIAV